MDFKTSPGQTIFVLVMFTFAVFAVMDWVVSFVHDMRPIAVEGLYDMMEKYTLREYLTWAVVWKAMEVVALLVVLNYFYWLKPVQVMYCILVGIDWFFGGIILWVMLESHDFKEKGNENGSNAA